MFGIAGPRDDAACSSQFDTLLPSWQGGVHPISSQHNISDYIPTPKKTRSILKNPWDYGPFNGIWAGRRAAANQSRLGTAKLNGIEPYAWLKQTIEKMPVWLNSRIDELLPLRTNG